MRQQKDCKTRSVSKVCSEITQQQKSCEIIAYLNYIFASGKKLYCNVRCHLCKPGGINGSTSAENRKLMHGLHIIKSVFKLKVLIKSVLKE